MTDLRDELTARLTRYDSLVEVGVGRRPDVAAALAAVGKEVTVTDVFDAPVPDCVTFVRDDIVERSETDPGDLYDVDAVYALNLPAELQRPAREVAREAGADFLFTTLGFEQPVVPVRSETLDGETLYLDVNRE
ncbi:MAG: UPF0146 family protein [Haloplanus sp.]